MNRVFLAAASLAALAACGGGQEAKAPSAPAEQVELAVSEISGPSAWALDREASSIQFRATQNNKEFLGSFSRWDASIVLNPEAPESEGQIEAVVDLASVDAGNKERNQALPEEGWFHIGLHPTATYRSGAITATEGGNYVAEGTLTIKGITQDVVMPFSLTLDETGRAIADGSVVLDRSAFGIGQGEFEDGKWVGLEVEVLLHMEAEPAS